MKSDKKHAIKRAILHMPVLGNVCWYIIGNQALKIRWGGVNRTIDLYLPAGKQLDDKSRRKLKRDIFLCEIVYNAKPEEYFLYHFQDKPHKERKSFLLDNRKDGLMFRKVGLEKAQVLKDKFRFYELMKEYYKREVIQVKHEADYDSFVAFTEAHHRFILKPIKGSRGQDTDIYDVREQGTDVVFKTALSISGGVVLEELICQSDVMALYNPSSVNTVRLPAILNKSGWHAWRPFLRVGRKGKVVDNAGAGGIIVALDEKTGRFLGKAADEKCNYYEKHPDSGLSLVEGYVPRWDELLQLAEEIHRKVPEQVYVGWDFALTDEGWVLIEGNWGQPVWQIPMQQGLLHEFKSFLKDR